MAKMNSLKALGFGVTILSAVTSLLSVFVEQKQTKDQIAKQVDAAVSKALKQRES